MIPEAKSVELKIRQENLPSVPKAFGAECGESSDERLPYLMLAQGSLDFIREGKARAGDIVDSETKVPVVPMGKPIEIIPFYLVKYWRVDKKLNGKTVKDRIYPYHKENDKDVKATKTEIIENGETKERYLNYMLYCLRPNALKEMPYIVIFKKGSLFTGKFVSGFFSKMGRMEISPASKTLNLSAVEAVNPVNGTVYFKFDVKEGRNTTAEEVNAAYEWYKITSKAAQHASNDHDDGE